MRDSIPHIDRSILPALGRRLVNSGETLVGVTPPQVNGGAEGKHYRCDYQEALTLPFTIITRHGALYPDPIHLSTKEKGHA